VVPIHPWYTDEKLELILSKVNGVIWQGGGRNLNLNRHFEKLNKYILDFCIRKNTKENKIFPLWGTCQGIELFYSLIYGTVDVLERNSAWKYYIPMKFDQSIHSSKMFKEFSEEDFNTLENKPSTVHIHNLGMFTDINEKFPLADDYKGVVDLEVTTWANDKNGKEFIGSCEDKRNNIFMTIFHPELLPYDYELSTENVYSDESVRVSSKLALGFVNLCKMNDHRFSSIEEMREYGLIENTNRMVFEIGQIPDYNTVEFLKFCKI